MRAAELFDISGKVAVVTGASRGIGAGTGRLFASAGARVALTYHNDKENAEALAAEINGSPGAGQPQGPRSTTSTFPTPPR